MQLSNGTVVLHELTPYDPAKAHAYYLRTRALKGRKKGSAQDITARPFVSNVAIKQKQQLRAQIQAMEGKLRKLEALILKKEHEGASEDRKSMAKKERAAKEADKPKTAAEKADIARQNKQYREKHKQELASKAKSSGGSKTSTSSKEATPEASVTELKTLATKVKGQIAVAKQKLAAL